MPETQEEYETPSDDQMARLNRAKEAAMDRLSRIPGVHTTGVGYKRRGGELTGELSVIAYVDHKLPPEEVDPEWLIPPEIRFEWDGDDTVVPTDVVERPRAVEYPHLADGSLAGYVRPVPGGRSIQGSLGGGTLGGWVWDDFNDQIVLLSNRHVLGTTVGANVYQPWGTTAAANQIADNVRTGTMDATIAAPTGDHASAEIEGIGLAVFAHTVAVLGMPVEKSGATTEHTTGTVVAVNLSKPGHIGSFNDFEVNPDPGQARFAYYGDSGSLIVERTPPAGTGAQRVVGLLWGGDPPLGNAYGHQIEDVFADLNLTALCEGTVAEAFDSMFARQFAVVSPPREFEFAGEEPRFQPALATRAGRPSLPWPRQRGLARDMEERIKQTERGQKLAELVHRNGVGLARLVMDPTSRRVLEAAAAPFVGGLWSASEVLERQVTDEDVARFKRALTTAAERVPDLEELVAEARSLLEEASGQSFARALQGRGRTFASE
jgi:hypothetical protein